MRITILTTFKEGREVFEKEDTRTVDDADGQRFINNGWAVAVGEQPSGATPPASVDLQTQNATHAVKGRNHG